MPRGSKLHQWVSNQTLQAGTVIVVHDSGEGAISAEGVRAALHLECIPARARERDEIGDTAHSGRRALMDLGDQSEREPDWGATAEHSRQ